MKKITGFRNGIAIALLSVAISGCATNGEQPNAFDNAANGLGTAAQSIGSAVGGLFQPYRNGVQVADDKLKLLTVGMTAEQVESTIGNPPEIESVNGSEVYCA